MDFRKPSFFFGGGVDLFFLRYQYFRDIETESSGSKQQILLRHRLSLSKQIFLNMSLGLEYSDRRFNNYYYGVRPHEVIRSRPLYTPKGDWSPITGITAIMSINERWSSIIGLNYKILSAQVKNSPTVIKSTKVTSFLGISYRLTK